MIAYAQLSTGRRYLFRDLPGIPAFHHPLLQKKKIVAHPGQRRIHKKITPSLGGVAIFLGFTVGSITWSIDPHSSVIFRLLPILIIPFIIGLFDDLIHLKPLAKLIAQWLTASLLFFILEIQISSSYGLFGEEAFSPALSYLITLFIVVIITNSLNLIDGIDGLAAAFSFVACGFFGTWFLFTGHYPYSILCFALAGAILAFLFQNWEPSNIFMGDTGSLVIGTVLSVITIRFINFNYELPDDDIWKFNSSIGTAICAMIVPLADTTRIIAIRLYNRSSLFTADKRHIHHALVRLGFTHRRAVYILTIVHVGMIALAVALRDEGEWILVAVVAVITLLLCSWLGWLTARTVNEEQPQTE